MGKDAEVPGETGQEFLGEHAGRRRGRVPGSRVVAREEAPEEPVVDNVDPREQGAAHARGNEDPRHTDAAQTATTAVLAVGGTHVSRGIGLAQGVLRDQSETHIEEGAEFLEHKEIRTENAYLII